jgi:hypothetical protein
MKKLIVTIAIVLGMGMTSFAQLAPEAYEEQGGGLFGRGEWTFELFSDEDPLLNLPGFGEEGDVDADVPLGSGIAVLMGLGAAYMVGKRRKEE